VILDACRNNPFDRTRGFRLGIRNVGGSGLARVDANAAVVVLMAAAPGQTADDGSELENSPFALVLARLMRTPGQTLGELPPRLANEVAEMTRGGQRPDQSGIISASNWRFIQSAPLAAANPKRPITPDIALPTNDLPVTVDRPVQPRLQQFPRRTTSIPNSQTKQRLGPSSTVNWLRAEARSVGFMQSGRSIMSLAVAWTKFLLTALAATSTQ
jgi:hypothetical protein